MKEVFSAFGSEVFRPLVTLLLPGGVAITPWYLGVLQRSNAVCRLVGENHTETAFVLVAIMLFVGLLLEDFGSYIEVRLFDAALNQFTSEEHSRNWYQYLRTVFKDEPVGVRYMRTVLLRMKFELGAAAGLAVAAAGCFTIDVPLSLSSMGALSVLTAGALLLREAKKSHAVLSRVRKELLSGVIVPQIAGVLPEDRKGAAR